MSGVPVLGVDAGGSAMRAVLVDDGRVLSRFEEPPLNVLLQADAVERLAALIGASGAVMAGLGLAGLRGRDHAADISRRLAAAAGVDVVVVDDTEAALTGAFGFGPGIVVIAGTGSNAIGRGSGGTTVRAGGYGFLLGDEGGAYWFGRQALRAALRSHDGSGPKSAALEAAVTDEYQLDLDGIVRFVYSDPADRQLFARLARKVMVLDHDPVMAGILDVGCDYLVDLVHVLRSRLETTQATGAAPVAMHGGVFGNAYLRARFVAATGAQAAARAPEFGAVDVALAHYRHSGHDTARTL